jgi:hypothetical protein
MESVNANNPPAKIPGDQWQHDFPERQQSRRAQIPRGTDVLKFEILQSRQHHLDLWQHQQDSDQKVMSHL